MPEGFASIADLKVIVDAETDKLKGGLDVAHNMVARFGSEGSRSLSLFDTAIQRSGEAVLLFKARVGVAFVAIEGAIALYQQWRGTLEQGAEAIGQGDQFRDLEKSVLDVASAFHDLGTGVAKTAQTEVAAFVASMVQAGGASDATASEVAGLGKALHEASVQSRALAEQTKDGQAGLAGLRANATAAAEAFRAAEQSLIAMRRAAAETHEQNFSVASSFGDMSGAVARLSIQMETAARATAAVSGQAAMASPRFRAMEAEITRAVRQARDLGDASNLASGHVGAFALAVSRASGEAEAGAWQTTVLKTSVAEAERTAWKASVTLGELGTTTSGAGAAASAASADYDALSEHIKKADEKSVTFATTMQGHLAQILQEVAYKIREMGPVASQSLATMEERLSRARIEAERLRQEIAKGTTFSADPFAQVILSVDELRAKLSALDVEIMQLETLSGMERAAKSIEEAAERQAQAFAFWDAMTKEGQKSIDAAIEAGDKSVANMEKQVRALELKAAALHMTAGAAAAYIAKQQALAEIEGKGLLTPDSLKKLDEQEAKIRQLTDTIDGHAKAKKAAADAERAIERTDKAFAGAERELALLKAKASAYGESAGAAAALAMEERLLGQLRSNNITITEAEITKARALAAEYGRLAEGEAQMRRLAEYTQIGARTMEQAFDKLVEGQKINWRDMIDSMIKDMMRLAFQQQVLAPLFGGRGGQGGGAIGSILGSITSSLGLGAGGGGGTTPTAGKSAAAAKALDDAAKMQSLPALPQMTGLMSETPAKAAAREASKPASVTVNITAPPGTQATETRRQTGEGGDMSLDILLEQFDGAIGRRIGDGTSVIGQALQSTYGLNPAVGAR